MRLIAEDSMILTLWIRSFLQKNSLSILDFPEEIHIGRKVPAILIVELIKLYIAGRLRSDDGVDIVPVQASGNIVIFRIGIFLVEADNLNHIVVQHEYLGTFWCFQIVGVIPRTVTVRITAGQIVTGQSCQIPMESGLVCNFEFSVEGVILHGDVPDYILGRLSRLVQHLGTAVTVIGQGHIAAGHGQDKKCYTNDQSAAVPLSGFCSGPQTVAHAVIIGMYDSELENAFNGSAVVEQIQLATQRLDTEEIVILQAKLLHIEDEHFIVEPVEGSPELNSASRIMVPMRNMAPSPEPVVGDILQIEYDGMLQETYPARITNVYHISVTHRTGEAYEPAGCSGDQVVELSDTPDNMHWEDGLGFGELAPGEEAVSDFEIRIDEDETPLILTITWARQSLVLEYGIRAEDGTEYSQEKRGGASILQISDIPAGVYHLFVRNCDVYHGIPSYEDPDKFKDVSFDATGALIYAFDQ